MAAEGPPQASLTGLPDDVLSHIFAHLDTTALVCLRGVSRLLEARVLALGIRPYLARNTPAAISLSPPLDSDVWSPTQRFFYATRTQKAIARHDVYASPVASWTRAIPAMCLAENGETLLFGAGTLVRQHALVGSNGPYTHRALGEAVVVDLDFDAARFGGNGHGHSNGFIPPTPSRRRARGHETGSDITGLHALPSGGFVVSQFDGTVRRFVGGRSTAHYAHPRSVHLLTGRGSLVLSVSGGGGSAGGSVGGSAGAWRSASASASQSRSQSAAVSRSTSRTSTPTGEPAAHLFNASTPWVPRTTLQLPSRAWSAHLCERGAFLGLKGAIAWHHLDDTGAFGASTRFSTSEMLLPLAYEDSGNPTKSAAYGLATRGSCSSSGPLASTLLSAWHDGVARLHDLRTRRQVLALSDPWSCAALFSATFVGGHGIVAGGAEHGIVNVWDVRFAKRAGSYMGGGPGDGASDGARAGDGEYKEDEDPRFGWSIFSPEGRGSPVYQLAGDGARVWGASERRGFVLAFDHDRVRAPGTKAVPLGSESRRRGNVSAFASVPVSAADPNGADDRVMGYRHGEGGMNLFESRVAAQSKSY